MTHNNQLAKSTYTTFFSCENGLFLLSQIEMSVSKKAFLVAADVSETCLKSVTNKTKNI